MNITVLGWIGYSNIGDEAYKLAFPIVFPNHSVNFVNSINNCDLSKTDLIILGGGDVVKTPFTKQLYHITIPKIAASVTLTNDSDLSNLKIFDKVFVRDIKSLDLAKKYYREAKLLPDFAFALEPQPIRGRYILEQKFGEANHKITPKVVSVVINSYISYNTDDAMHRDTIAFDKMIHELSRICESFDSSFVFVPFSTRSPQDDRAPCAWLAERCKKKYRKNLMIYDKLSVQDTLDVIACSQATISTRLHSSIFSTLSGTPFVDILHHDKNLGFLQTVGKADWGTWLWQFDAKKIESLLRDFLLKDKAFHARELVEFTKKSKEELKGASQLILR